MCSSRPPSASHALRRYAPGGARGADQDRPRRRRLGDRQAAHPRVGAERRVGGHPHRVDRLAPRPHAQRGGGAERGVRVQRRDQLLEEVRVAVDVVVEQDHDVAVTERDRPVAGFREPAIVLGAGAHDVRPLGPDALERVVARPVVTQQDPVLTRLRGEVLEAALGEVVAVVGHHGDVDRQAHAVIVEGVVY